MIVLELTGGLSATALAFLVSKSNEFQRLDANDLRVDPRYSFLQRATTSFYLNLGMDDANSAQLPALGLASLSCFSV